MDVVIAGGHGQIAMPLARLLTERGDRVRSLIRNPDHEAEVKDTGAEPVLADLEQDDAGALAGKIGGADAIVFAAGAGPNSGAERKRTLDRDGAVKLVEAAKQAGVGRYVIVSSMGAGDPPSPENDDDVFAVYLRAKADADIAVADSGLDFTIVRPGRLTNDAPTGQVEAASSVPRGEIPRADVAAVLVAVLDDPRTIGATFELVGGHVPVADAVGGL
jgi:nucleoside-diphosphate-sugar epimerase